MSSEREKADEYDLKQCGRCAAWIPRTATMCAACGTTSPDARIDPRPSRSPIGLPRGVTVTRVLIGANLLWFLVSLWVQHAAAPGTPLAPLLIEGRGFNPGLARTGMYMHERVVGGEWWRVLAATFLHGGVVHLALNMWSLNSIGQLAEDIFGGAKLLAIYLVCGACSALAVSAWFVGVQGGADAPYLVGASGAIFGVAGLVAAFLLRRSSMRGRAIGMQIGQSVIVMLVLGYMLPFVSNTGHVGGLIPGVLIGLVVRERFSTHLSPAARANWWLVATLASVAALVALVSAGVFAARNL